MRKAKAKAKGKYKGQGKGKDHGPNLKGETVSISTDSSCYKVKQRFWTFYLLCNTITLLVVSRQTTVGNNGVGHLLY